MPFVPDQTAAAPQGAPSKFVPDTPKQDDSAGKLGPLASGVARPLLKGANYIINFIPDLATDAVNQIPESVLGPKTQRPSQTWDNIIDKYTTKPSSPMAKTAEFVDTALVSGSRGAASLAMAVPGLLRQGSKWVMGRITSKAAENAISAGYKLPPSYIGGGVSKTVQTMAGGPKVEKTMSAFNEEVSDRLAQTELGLHPEFPGNELSDTTFEALKTEAYQPYQELRRMGAVAHDQQFFADLKAAGGRFANRTGYGTGARFASVDAEKLPYMSVDTVDASSMVDEVRQLRKLSRQNLKQYNPEANALGYTQREIANAIENQLSRSVKDPALLDRMRAARVQLSKISAVEDSMGAGGHINAQDLKKLMDSGVPLSGNLKTIAETASNFSKAVQPISKSGETGIWSAVDYLLGGTGIVEGQLGITGLSFARPISRWALGTKPVQRSKLKGLQKTGPSTSSEILSTTARGAALETYEGN